MTGVICIGRNIKNLPMDEIRWREFAGDVCAIVHRSGGTIYNTAFGNGWWEGEPEETFVCTFECVKDISEDLETLAFMYEQEAVALIKGESELISGGRPEVIGDNQLARTPTSFYGTSSSVDRS